MPEGARDRWPRIAIVIDWAREIFGARRWSRRPALSAPTAVSAAARWSHLVALWLYAGPSATFLLPSTCRSNQGQCLALPPREDQGKAAQFPKTDNRGQRVVTYSFPGRAGSSDAASVDCDFSTGDVPISSDSRNNTRDATFLGRPHAFHWD